MNYEPVVKQFFENLGYKVKKITETNDKSPDFWIRDDTYSYILELKTKFPSREEIERRKRVLYTGAIHTVHETVIGKNTLSSIIKTAKDQLNSLREENALRIVWLLATGYLAEPRMLQFEATLYGIAPIVSSERTGDCYFFYNSDFYRFREILDGAIVSTESQAKFLLNPLSPRYERIKGSSLTKHFGKSVVDPIELERFGKAFLVDSQVGRGDKDAVLCYLRQKYGSEDLMNLTMEYLSGTLVIPNVDQEHET
jgi:hypothetical protein